MTLPSPLELSVLGGSLIALAGVSAWLLPTGGIRLAMYLGAASALCFLAAGVAHTYKEQGVADQAAKDAPVMAAATAQLRADIDAFNKIAQLERERKADNERDAEILRSTIAAGAVREAAAKVQRDNAEAEAKRLLAKYHDALSRIPLPGVVRNAFNTAAAGGSDGRASDVRPDPVGPPDESAAPVDAATFTETCVADVTAHRLLVSQYDRLYEYAAKLYQGCSAHPQ